ncbi:MAG: hypothetical protein A2X12_09285 [Bacteroidetes bacterium GWE2_29_8]|nr:MAG: hypothetical protein A2X12_09285 [Bacteroidetes bacterium GWE2_29_8]
MSEDLLKTYTNKDLLDKYDIYQHLMNFWAETMQDDCYIIAAEGWKAELIVRKQTKKETIWDCDLVPKVLVIDRCFKTEKLAIEKLEADKDMITSQIDEMIEEHSSEDGYFAELDKVNKANIQKRMKEIDNVKLAKNNADEITVLKQYLTLTDNLSELTNKIKVATTELDKKVINRYKTLTEDEIKTLVVDDKWVTAIERAIKTEMERLSQRLTQRLKELSERYETQLFNHTAEVAELEKKVKLHLTKMGFE